MPEITLPRQFVRTRRFSLGVPSAFTVAPDGASILFVRTRSGEDPASCLWAMDLDSGAERLLADPVELLGGAEEEVPEEERVRRERAREHGGGIVAYAADDAAELAAFALSGELWLVDATTGLARRLQTDGEVVDPRLDPTGRRIAYLSRGSLRVIEADGSGDRAVATPDGPEVWFGVAEHVATESMHRSRGYWWAPDGERLLIARVDRSPVAMWYVTDPAEPIRPPRVVRYPAAGTPNVEVTLWITSLDGARTELAWDRGAFEYVTAAGWDANGPYAAVQSRDQRTIHVLSADPEDGSVRMIAEQLDERWVQLVVGTPARTAAGALVGHADVDSTRHLTIDGVNVTPSGLQLREVLALDGDDVLFTASAEPTEIHLWTVRAGEEPRRLSAEPGVHTGTLRAGTLIHSARTSDCPGTRVAVRRSGRPPVEVRSVADPPVLALRSTMLTTTDRALRSRLLLPSWHRTGTAKLPVLLDPYAGPAGQRVTADQPPLAFVSQWFAEQGFAVLVTDGRGTPGRGPVWEREVYGDMFGPVLDDQVAALHEAARQQPDLDLGRVGIRGWSFSGSLAAIAVLRRPDVFHAAVAGAGVTDQRLYDTHWRERFLGHPDAYPERYAESSLLLAAPRLTRPLLLIHGLADDNVFAANTLRFSSALVAAGRPHEVLPLSGSTHAVSDEAVFENLLLHQLEFLGRSLRAAA